MGLNIRLQENSVPFRGHVFNYGGAIGSMYCDRISGLHGSAVLTAYAAGKIILRAHLVVLATRCFMGGLLHRLFAPMLWPCGN